MEAIVICLGALVAMRVTDVPTGTLWAVAGPAAVLCILLCARLSASWAVPAGWVLQAALLAAGFVVPMMFVIGVIFAATWYGCVRVGRTIDAAKAARA
jgi:hypothetical protein